MNPRAALLRHARDPRLYLFLGLANWSIFLDHIPNNAVSWFTLRNFGFTGSSDVFVFIIGYVAALTYAPIMLERGTIVGATRVVRRAWQLYASFIVLFAVYAVMIGDVATRYAAPELIYEFHVAGLLEEPVRTVAHGLLLQSPALNLDLLQLAVLLTACFPSVLWLLLRAPALMLTASMVLYLTARQFGWTLSTFPDGSWYFNPFCWQLVYVFGAWCALGGASRFRSLFRGTVWAYIGIAYLFFAFAIAMAGHFALLGDMLPGWLHDAFIPNDRTNLAPYRILNLMVLALFATRLIPKNWRYLTSPILRPLIVCGEQSLSVFCVGVFLSFAGHVVLVTDSGSVAEQILVSLTGLLLMTLAASYVSWSKRQDKHQDKRPVASIGRNASLTAG